MQLVVFTKVAKKEFLAYKIKSILRD